ncbi:hypothetical protein GQ600_2434 [Phytophthora cactorum]|nr:hypothetical protein GQ600_2434 [Phytophthora cactorum]
MTFVDQLMESYSSLGYDGDLVGMVFSILRTMTPRAAISIACWLHLQVLEFFHYALCSATAQRPMHQALAITRPRNPGTKNMDGEAVDARKRTTKILQRRSVGVDAKLPKNLGGVDSFNEYLTHSVWLWQRFEQFVAFYRQVKSIVETPIAQQLIVGRQCLAGELFTQVQLVVHCQQVQCNKVSRCKLRKRNKINESTYAKERAKAVNGPRMCSLRQIKSSNSTM